MENTATNDDKIVCRTAQGMEIEADVKRLTRYLAVFEIRNPNCSLQLSEVLPEFKIYFHNKLIYSGRAVTSNLVNTGAGIVCEATLDNAGLNTTALGPARDAAQLQAAYGEFLQNWGKNYKIQPEFKVLLADMVSYLSDLRLWLQQLELGTSVAQNGHHSNNEPEMVAQLAASVTPTLCTLFERFEELTRNLPADAQPAHRAFCRRQLHPLLLCSPFMNRIYTKPLGYAGDYEMVNMILRNKGEGDSLYARLLNVFILSQSPAVAHRNRVRFLIQKLLEETNRMAQQGRTAKIFNIGCGPAGELQAFIRDHPVSDHLDATLLDSNDETLAYTGQILAKIKSQNLRRTTIRTIKKSVYQLLKVNTRAKAGAGEFDLIYCAGLFDYLDDRACEALLGIFYNQLAPGGLLVATNVDSCNPIINIMEYIFEWHLIYRSGREFAALAPKAARPEDIRVTAEESSSNIFIEVRKPLRP